MSELICAWILDETTPELAEKAKYQVEPHPEETIQLPLTTQMMCGELERKKAFHYQYNRCKQRWNSVGIHHSQGGGGH